MVAETHFLLLRIKCHYIWDSEFSELGCLVIPRVVSEVWYVLAIFNSFHLNTLYQRVFSIKIFSRLSLLLLLLPLSTAAFELLDWISKGPIDHFFQVRQEPRSTLDVRVVQKAQ